MKIENLEQLASLRDKGIITEEEFQTQKNRALNQTQTSTFNNKFGMSGKSYNMFIHLSQYLCYFLPIVGIVGPLFLWLASKDQDPEVDHHGRAVLNWNLSLMLYYLICILACFVIIGFFVIWIPILLSIVYPVIGALMARDAKVFSYPFSIKFLRMPSVRYSI